jgi:NADH-quinone oxidoreductase subunit B
MTLQQKIDEQHLRGPNQARHLRPDEPSEFTVPELGEHDLVPPKNPRVWVPPALLRAE